MNNTEQNKKHSSKALEIWTAKNERLAQVPLDKTLKALNALPFQDRDRNKWKIVGIGNIIVKDQVWFNGNLQVSGFGSVQLVQHALGMDGPTEAMNWLSEKFPEELEGDWKESVKIMKKNKKPQEENAFTPPERYDEGLDEVRDYLINSRGLPPSLIEREIQSGRLYASKQRDEKTGRYYGDVRCIFIGPSSAEIRSVERDGFKGCCKGSDSDRSGYQVMFNQNFNKKIALVEAAVDALSYHALNPEAFVLSTNGSGRFELQYKITLESYRNNCQTIWAFDNDGAGDLAAQQLFNALFLREKLSQIHDVPKELVDRWIIEKKILAVPEHSPHQIFINNYKNDQHPVFEKNIDNSDPKNPVITYEDTGRKEPASITFKVLKATVPLKKNMGQTFTVTPDDVESILKEYNIFKDTPKNAKDWNEIWKKGGQAKVNEYEKYIQETKANKTKNNNDTQKTTKKENDDLSKNIVEGNKDRKAQGEDKPNLDTSSNSDSDKREFTGRFSRRVKR